MKIKIIIVISFLSIYLQAVEKRFKAIIRDKNFRPVEREVLLKDLTSNSSFKGRYFKIVKGKENKAIGYTEKKNILLKAATLYFHLTKARDFFVNQVESDFVKNKSQIVIRLDISNSFSDLGHFKNDNFEPEYNNALTVPPGVGYPSKGIKPWDTEIWFRSSKVVNLKDLGLGNNANGNFNKLLSKYRKKLHKMNFQKFLVAIALSQTGQNNSATIDALVRTGGTSLMMETIFHSSDFMIKTFSRKNYHLDTALIPEIIYHEFAHLALSDKLLLTHSTSVNEGMADFFAGVIADSPKLAIKIKKYNTFNGKDATKKEQYRLLFDTSDYANSDFVFGLLWGLQDVVGPSDAKKIVMGLAGKISTDSNIRTDLVDAIISQASEVCEDFNLMQYKLYDYLINVGF